MARLFGGKNNPDKTNAGYEEGIEFSPGWIFSLAKERQPQYTGKLLAKQNGRLLLGIYADKQYEFNYKENDVVTASFVELKVLYNFNVRILKVRELETDIGEGFEIDRMANKLDSTYGYDKYIIEAAVLAPPKKQQKREFFRMTLKIDIYYKIIEQQQAEEISSGNLKFEFAAAGAAKEEADLNFLESEGGYLKLTTFDISAGGFRVRSAVSFEEGALLDCIVIAGYEALPATAKILSAKPEPDNPGIYDVRAIFYEIGNPIRDRIVKFILLQQKQLRSRFLGNRF